MNEVRCKCPKCNTVLRLKASGERAKLNCQNCQHVFTVKLPRRTTPAAVARPAGHQPMRQQRPRPQHQDPFQQLPGFRQAAPLPLSKRRTLKKKTNLALPIGIAIGAFLLLAIVGGVVAIMFFAVSPTGVASGGSGSSAFGSNRKTVEARRPSNDSRQSVFAETTRICDQIEAFGRGLPAGDESDGNAQLLNEKLKLLKPMLVRACGLDPIPVNLKDGAASMAQSLEVGQPSEPPPGQTYFWSINTRNMSGKPVSAAINELTKTRWAIYTQLNLGLAEIRSPLTNDQPDVDWSDEDRRVLAIMRAQGQLARDFAQELSFVNAKTPSANSLKRLHQIIDQYSAEGNKIKQLKGDSGLIASLPKNSIYEQQKNAARVALLRLKKLIVSDSEVDQQLDWLLKEYRQTDGALGELVFFSGKRAEIPTDSSNDRYLAFVDSIQQAETAKKDAEKKAKDDAARIAEEQRLAKEKQRRKDEEASIKSEADRVASNEAKNAFSGGGRTGSGRPQFGGRAGSGRPRGGFGPGGFEPQGPRGNQGSFTPNRPPRQNPADENRDTSKDVVIQVANPKQITVQSANSGLPPWLKQYGISMAGNNLNLKITIKNFDKPLSDLQSAFPNLKFDKIDEQTRNITATEK